MRIPERDVETLTAIGRFRMLTRQQVKRWQFTNVAEPVVTRFIQRQARSGWLGVERLHGNGIQVLWLTRKGRDGLVARGVAAADLFPASGPAAAKDFEHTRMIGQAAAWLATQPIPPDELLPAWALQRYFAGRMPAVPDLLAVWKREPPAALAVEVDLGTEPLASVFLPKLGVLQTAFVAMLPDMQRQILVLVPSERRRQALAESLSRAGSAIMVDLLSITAGSVNSDGNSS